MKLTLKILFLVALMAASLATALTLPASAERRSVTVRMTDGTTQAFVVEVDPGTPLAGMAGMVPGEPLGYTVLEEQAPAEAPPAAETFTPTPAPQAPAEEPTGPAPAPGGAADAPPAEALEFSEDRAEHDRAERERPEKEKRLRMGLPPKKRKAADHGDAGPTGGAQPRETAPLRNSDGSPATSNPGLVDALPGPSTATGVPNFVIRKFRVPVFLLPIYQAAGIQYGVRWEVLAAINEIETDYGRNLNVSSAGALGWMQFIPSSWRAYGVDANKDGRKDPYNPVDAIFAAARYLKAAGYEQDVRRSIFAYNHADWYVDSVMMRARLIAGVPADLVGSLTGLTEGRFPVAARARYADDIQEKEALKRVKQGQNAANVVETNDDRRTVQIYAQKGSPVVATNDGQIKKIGVSNRVGRYIVLQDVYGNHYRYTGLGQTAKYYPVPREEAATERSARALSANAKANRDSKPATPASSGRQPNLHSATDSSGPASEDQASVPVKERIFAHPDSPGARESGGLEQLMDMKAVRDGGFATYDNRFARPIRLDPKRFRLRRLRKGANVIGGTVLGRVGRPVEGKAAHLEFGIRPAGRGAPRIDPKPILDGWKLLEATAIYRASGKNALHNDTDAFSIGQILLMPKRMLERRVLGDERIELYAGGREDVRTGQIDRRVLASLAYLAESGMRPTVTSLKSGHGFLTSSGNVSHHSSGNAVDIAAINGIPIIGHQEPGGVTEQAVRRLMRLQGTMAPDQIISLFDIGGATLAMSDHADHIHLGFQPRFGANSKLGRQAQAVLKPGQWPELLKRLEEIENPIVPTKPSPYSLPTRRLKNPGGL